jgi:hypothetical protein
VGVLASLVSVAVAGTGAYYTDTVAGTVSGNNGTVAISASGNTTSGNLAFDFSGILPGVAKTATITVTNTGSGPEDIYLAFDNSNNMWSAVNDLGQYGKFVINGNTYDNLNNKTGNATTGVAGSPISDSYINTTDPTNSCYMVPRVPVNYLPHVIFLGTLPAGSAAWPFTISFQYIACMSDHKGQSLFNAATWDLGGTAPAAGTPLLFKVAAFQPGISPTNTANGTGAIPNLVLPITQDLRTPTKGTEQ